MSGKPALCVYIYRSLTPCSPQKLLTCTPTTFLNLTQGRNPLHPESHHLSTLHSEHPNNSVLTKANLNVAFLCTSFPSQFAGLEASACFGLHDNLPTSYLLLCSFTKWPGDPAVQFSSCLEVFCHIYELPKCDKEQCQDRTTTNYGQ